MRLGLRTLAMLLFLLGCSGMAAAQSADRQVCAGNDADRALSACSALLENSHLPASERAKILTDRGVAFGRKTNYDRAIADFEGALKILPDDIRARNFLGISYRHKGEYDRAIAEYNKVLRNHPRDEHALNNRGVAWRWKRDYERSLADFSAAIAASPKYALAYSNRGVVYRLQLDYIRALVDHDKAIQLAPKAAPTYYERGATYEAKGDYKQALKDYRQAAELNPKNETTVQAVKRLERRLEQAEGAPLAARPAKGAEAALHPPANAPDGEVRIALVIGNSTYASVAALPNPKRDAAALAAALKSVGFTTVTLKFDQSREQLMDTLKDFAAAAERADWAVVYYAGHGIEAGGNNYLIPVNAKLAAERDVKFETVALEQVLQAVDGARKLRLVILDACRDNPFVKKMTRTATRSLTTIGQGLANIEPEGATLVAYAAKHGQLAMDGDGENSPFVASLVKNLPTPGLEINLLFRKVRDEVLAATGRQQEPFTYGSLPSEPFYFRKP